MGISEIKKPLAIAMWDFSWLLRHHKYGGFENWDAALDGLVKRGYNAIRIDCFPHWVSGNDMDNLDEEVYCPKNECSPALWGNQYTVKVKPRRALLEFLPKCRERGIKVGLATWYCSHGNTLCNNFKGVDGFFKSWDDTLSFLDWHGLLNDVLYVDLLNEYPFNHGFDWLKRALRAKQLNVDVSEIVSENAGLEHLWKGNFDSFSTDYHITFLNEAIAMLSQKWPKLDLFASLTPFYENMAPEDAADISNFAALDMHIWFGLNDEFAAATNWWQDVLPNGSDMRFDKCNRAIKNFWSKNKESQIKIMEGKIKATAITAKKYGIPYGNTEGWGVVNWNDHPSLDWDFIKEAAEICAKLGIENGYIFNCTSNFTHPHFTGYWNDVKWHQKVTSIIKGE